MTFFERSASVEINHGERFVNRDGRRRRARRRGRMVDRAATRSARRQVAPQQIERRFDFGSDAVLAKRERVDVLVVPLTNDADPSLPDARLDDRLVIERLENVHLEFVDVLERNARDGSERFVAVRVVLKRLVGEHESAEEELVRSSFDSLGLDFGGRASVVRLARCQQMMRANLGNVTNGQDQVLGVDERCRQDVTNKRAERTRRSTVRRPADRLRRRGRRHHSAREAEWARGEVESLETRLGRVAGQGREEVGRRARDRASRTRRIRAGTVFRRRAFATTVANDAKRVGRACRLSALLRLIFLLHLVDVRIVRAFGIENRLANFPDHFDSEIGERNSRTLDSGRGRNRGRTGNDEVVVDSRSLDNEAKLFFLLFDNDRLWSCVSRRVSHRMVDDMVWAHVELTRKRSLPGSVLLRLGIRRDGKRGGLLRKRVVRGRGRNGQQVSVERRRKGRERRLLEKNRSVRDWDDGVVDKARSLTNDSVRERRLLRMDAPIVGWDSDHVGRRGKRLKSQTLVREWHRVVRVHAR